MIIVSKFAIKRSVVITTVTRARIVVVFPSLNLPMTFLSVVKSIKGMIIKGNRAPFKIG